MFKNLKITNWRQYENIEIDFHNRITLLTGANGAGKTTLLNILNQHFGWNYSFVGTRKKDLYGVLRFDTDIYLNPLNNFSRKTITLNPNYPGMQVQLADIIGEIMYDTGDIRNITIPKNVTSAAYQLLIQNIVLQKGVVIPSHRPNFRYQNITNIPISYLSKQNSFNQYNNVRLNRWANTFSNDNKAENYYLKEALISLATFGYGNIAVEQNIEAKKIFEGFIEILKTVLPPKLGFKTISIRIPDVILETESGDFSLDAVSGGISSIIDLAWTIFMSDNDDNFYSVTLDEPENHLHPEMQKTLLPNFLKAFPKVQFIIATHNPFIISSVSDSNVYVLDYNENKKVVSLKLENIEKSGTANEILREVLGIESTMPNWVDVKIDAIISKYSNSGITSENVQKFKSELKEVGLEKYVSASVVALIEGRKKND